MGGDVNRINGGMWLLIWSTSPPTDCVVDSRRVLSSWVMMTRSAALIALGIVLRHGCDGFGVGRPTTARCSGGTGAGMRRTRGWSVRAQQPPTAMSAAVATSSPPVDLSGDGGVTREMLREGSGKGLATGDIATVRFTGTVAETGQVFSKGDEYLTTLEDGTMISGWDTGLAGLRKGDRAIIRCTSRYGYGAEGITPVVPPSADLVFDVELLENEGNIMNPATFVDANPLTPRTPDTIAEAFDSKSRRKALAMADAAELEGLDKVIAWVKNIYIFGLFEGETGEEAPWYLKPLITFPIMITICGVAFYAVILLGGVTTDRGTGVQDDPMLASTLGAYALRQAAEALA